MADTPRETERQELDEPDKNTQNTGDAPVERAQEEAREVVQEAKHEVAAARLPWYSRVKRGYIFLGVYGVLLILFALLATFVHFHPVLGVDVTITKEFQENQTPWLSGLMTAVSYIGYQLWLSIGLVALAVVILWV